MSQLVRDGQGREVVRAAGHCRRCPATVLWVVLPGGARMPVDPYVDPAGNLAAMRDARGVWVGHVLKKTERPLPYERLFVPHFATCAPTVAHRQAVRDGRVVDLAQRRRRAARSGSRRT